MAILLQSELSLDFKQPQVVLHVIGCDFPKPPFTLSLHHCQAALSTASEGEDGAELKT